MRNPQLTFRSHLTACTSWIRRRAAALAVLTLTLVVPSALLRAEESPDATAAEQLGEAAILDAGPLNYRPGRGLRLGDTGAVVGGFTNIKGEHTGEGGEFSIDTLNVFLIFDRFTRFRAVAELQFGDIYTADKHNTGTQDFAFDVRRLFGDFTVSDLLHVRAGTFLTPVGYWNLILAPPLTWTTEPPEIDEESFYQQTTTGLMLYGSTPLSQGRLGYSLFSQFLQPLEDNPDLAPPDHTAGLRLDYNRGAGLSIGATYQGAENNGDWSQMGALHFFWQRGRAELLGELLYQDGGTLDSSQWGTYLQGVYNFYGPLYYVFRYEHFDQPEDDPTLNLFTIGGVYKPFPFMAIKAEYRFANTDPEDDRRGFFSSFTTFF